MGHFLVKFFNLITALVIYLYISIYDSPEGRRPADRSTSAKKIGPSDRDLMTMDKSESYYFGVLNKIYLQNLLHGL